MDFSMDISSAREVCAAVLFSVCGIRDSTQPLSRLVTLAGVRPGRVARAPQLWNYYWTQPRLSKN